MLYVAVRSSHPVIAVVRLALPLTEVGAQVAEVRRLTLIAIALALAGALAMAVIASSVLSRRLNAIAEAARRFASGDLVTPGSRLRERRDRDRRAERSTARCVELAQRVQELARDRARADAILSGMVEGVMVVDGSGHVQLVNPRPRGRFSRWPTRPRPDTTWNRSATRWWRRC